MNFNDEQLKSAIIKAAEEYHFYTGKNDFWAPYIRNDNFTQDPNVPRGLGKSSPEDIKKSIDYIIELFPDASSEDIRLKLIDGKLPDKTYNYKGIDCSGFVYHVFDKVYSQMLQRSFMEDLSVPKSHVLNGARNLEEWKSAYNLSDQEAESLPDDVPMKWVVDKFKRKPINLCRVTGIVSDYSSIAVSEGEMLSGDVLYIQQVDSDIPHVAIITNISEGVAEIVHSGRSNPADIGGVMFEKVPIVNGLPDTLQLNTPRTLHGVRRLKSISAALAK